MENECTDCKLKVKCIICRKQLCVPKAPGKCSHDHMNLEGYFCVSGITYCVSCYKKHREQ